MVWDIINGLVAVASAATVAFITTFFAGLPTDPLAVPSSVLSSLTHIAGYTTWFFPVHIAVLELAGVVSAVGALIIGFVLWRLLWHFTYF